MHFSKDILMTKTVFFGIPGIVRILGLLSILPFPPLSLTLCQKSALRWRFS